MTFSPENLVPNPSFEDTVNCPTYISQLHNARHWFSPTSNTPDYFNACFDDWVNASPDVPVNAWGTQNAHFGNAYAGFATYYSAPNGREYIATQLTDTLKSGKRYCFEFFVSLSDSSVNGTNNLALYFSETNDTTTGFFGHNLAYTPAWESASIIVDTQIWTPIRGSFIAQGGEKYMFIGVFKPDSLLGLDTLRYNGLYKLAYYYIDDVAVWNCDTAPVVYSNFTLFPNPSNGQFNITGNFPAGSELIVYDILGQIWCNPIALPEGNNNVPVFLNLAQGAYFYKIHSNGVLLDEGRIVIVK
jgi:hypothetical protein